MQGIGLFFTTILGRIAGVLGWTGALAVAAFSAMWFLGTDLFVWLFDQSLGLAASVLDTFSFDAELFNPAAYIDALPPEILDMLRLCRVGECMAIIAASVVVRIMLQLIPFTRLGS